MAEEGGTAPAAPEESSAEAAVTEEAAAEQTEKPGKASKGSKPAATLADAFKLHASKGSGSEATSADVNKWCKDAGIFGKTCDSGHVDISFTKCKQKTAKSVTARLIQLLYTRLLFICAVLQKMCTFNYRKCAILITENVQF